MLRAPTTHPLLDRWRMLQLHVRCALDAGNVERIRQYLACGQRLARAGALGETAVQLRMLHTLLRTARDEALPWFWRSVCLEHTAMPLARLRSLVEPHDPLGVLALEAAVQRGFDDLPMRPA